MSLNKNALIRYQVLDRCFRNPGRMYFIEDLLEECNKALFEYGFKSDGIKKRQLFDDIKFMESEAGWSIPLKRYRYGRRIYYRYEDIKFSINNQQLNNIEIEQIKSAIKILTRISGTPEFEWINQIIPFLESKFGRIKEKNKVINFEINIDLKGIHFITPLFNAIINERVLLVEYKDFKSSKPYKISFHPYYLKQYNNRWFVFGLNEEKKISNYNLALDRIENLSETDIKYQTSDIDWDDYFYDIIGVTRPINVEIQKIILNFTKELAPYIITKPIHPSQKHKMINDILEVKINVIPNYELEQLILSFGDNVTVIAPENLRNSIFTKIKSAYNNYL